jgi:hypothetical protein
MEKHCFWWGGNLLSCVSSHALLFQQIDMCNNGWEEVKSKQAYYANVGVYTPNIARESRKENVITSVVQFIFF